MCMMKLKKLVLKVIISACASWCCLNEYVVAMAAFAVARVLHEIMRLMQCHWT